jgi:tetratricopeptide (TPR) repeat protein
MQNIDQLNNLLEQAQELEEKGDRYVEGQKAYRFYIRSCELYSMANDIEADLPQVLTNWARILFILSEFKNPQTLNEQACIWLRKAIDIYLKLASIEPDNDDVLFNLAQTLHLWVLKSNSDFYKLNEAIWYLDQMQGIEKDTPDTLVLKIEILNSIMEFSNDLNEIQKVFKAVTDLYMEDAKEKNYYYNNNIITRIAESFHVFGFRLHDINGIVDSSVFSRAIEMIDLVLNRDPNNIEALCDKSDLCTDWADLDINANSTDLYTIAVESLTKASQLDPRNTDIMTRLGDIHLSRLVLYSNDNTRVTCAKNAKVYYQNALSTKPIKPQMWPLFHFVKACTWISDDYSDKAWEMLMLMADDNNLSIDEWIKSNEVLDVPFGPFYRYKI